MEPPKYPIGPFAPEENADLKHREEWILEIEKAPALLRQAVSGLSEPQLDTLYKNWTIRQITHHLADSHMNSFIRFKWALTEDTPLIKAYDETLWSELPDARTGSLEAPLRTMEGLHARWIQLLRGMTPEMFLKSFRHPDRRTIPLSRALGSYAWHGRHHTGQILWIRQQRGWA